MFKAFSSSVLVAAVSAIDQTTFEFMQYLSRQGKSYSTLEEFNKRKELFANIDEIIKAWNADETNTSRMGHNFLSDWTPEEKKKLNGLNPKTRQEWNGPVFKATPTNATPTTWDWCTAPNNKCTPIKN